MSLVVTSPSAFHAAIHGTRDTLGGAVDHLAETEAQASRRGGRASEAMLPEQGRARQAAAIYEAL